MKIQKIESGQVSVCLSPADCLLLAHACNATADYLHETRDRPVDHPAAYTFDVLGRLLESYALLGDADGRVVNRDGEFFNRDAIARNWGVRPGLLGGGR